MAHATNDVSAVRNCLGPGIMYPSDTLMTFLMVLVIMLSTDLQLTLLALIPLPLISFAVYHLGRIVHKKFEERQEQYTNSPAARRTFRASGWSRHMSGKRMETGLFGLSWDLKKNLVLARVQSIMWPAMFCWSGFGFIICPRRTR
jgi:ATP-binding cassette subfamily B protein